jgi:hypothetical protein
MRARKSGYRAMCAVWRGSRLAAEVLCGPVSAVLCGPIRLSGLCVSRLSMQNWSCPLLSIASPPPPQPFRAQTPNAGFPERGPSASMGLACARSVWQLPLIFFANKCLVCWWLDFGLLCTGSSSLCRTACCACERLVLDIHCELSPRNQVSILFHTACHLPPARILAAGHGTSSWAGQIVNAP